MAIVEVSGLSYSYGKVRALRDVTFAVPEGALYALLGPNGSGKTTLLQILTGLRRARAGRAMVMGVESHALTARHRTAISYVAEGQSLPRWMRMEQLEAYLAPLYPSWDVGLARQLRERFALDPQRRVGTLSRGERMKAALLCALAPRPKLLIMDEPFSGMDALVRDELVRGLLESSGAEGWTVLLCSHDIGELELLADHVGFLARGEMQLSQSMESLRQRFKRVTVIGANERSGVELDPTWLDVERTTDRLRFLVSNASDQSIQQEIASRFSGAERLDVDDVSLREIFVALARRSHGISEGVAA